MNLGLQQAALQSFAPRSRSPFRPLQLVRRLLPGVFAGVALGCALLGAAPARAQIGSDRYSSMVIDAGSGSILEAANPDAPRYPASLTKMMTLYMTFEALRDRRLALDAPVPVSAEAAAAAPSKLGLRPGTRLTVQQAILALVTKSANDAAVALAERLGGTEDRFAQMMTLRARALGMTRTTFRNASGLPDPEQVTTARDQAALARHLVRDFPDQYRYFSVPGFVFHGRTIPNHDNLLRSYVGADGIKTGYTDAAGHNLVSSATRGDVRLIGVVMGAGSNPERDAHMMALLDQGFARMNVAEPAAGSLPLLAHVPSLVPSAHAATVLARGTPRAHLAHARHGTSARGTVRLAALRTRPAATADGQEPARGAHPHRAHKSQFAAAKGQAERPCSTCATRTPHPHQLARS